MEASTVDSSAIPTALSALIDTERQPPSAWCVYFPFTISIFLASLVTIFGLASNFFTIVLLWSDRKKSATMLLLILLAISDSFLLAWFVGVHIVPEYFEFIGDPIKASEISSPFIAYSSFFANVSQMTSIWLTVLVTWQRYVGACKPFLYAKYGSIRAARLSASVVFVGVVTVCIPSTFDMETTKLPSGIVIPKQRSFAENKYFSIMFTLVLHYALNYIAPIVALIYMTYALICKLKKIRRTRESMTSSSSNKEQVTLSVVVVVVISIFTFILGPLRKTLVELYPDPEENACGGVLFYFSSTFLVILFSGGCNFVVYVLFVKKLRKKAANLLLRRCRRVEPAIDNAGSSEGAGHTQVRTQQTNTNSAAGAHPNLIDPNPIQLSAV